MELSTHPKGDYVNGDVVICIQEPTFRLERFDASDDVPIGTYGKIVNYDDGDNTWLVDWQRPAHGLPTHAAWTDPECFDYDTVTDEELDEVYAIFGVANPNK